MTRQLRGDAVWTLSDTPVNFITPTAIVACDGLGINAGLSRLAADPGWSEKPTVRAMAGLYERRGVMLKVATEQLVAADLGRRREASRAG